MPNLYKELHDKHQAEINAFRLDSHSPKNSLTK